MKVLKLSTILLLTTIFSASAQLSAVKHNFDKSRSGRTEIILPQVNGYNVYKADLHLHSIYSDGEVTPALRVMEAWQDGLDIIAITDHMECRRIEREMYRYMNEYIRPELRGEPKAINTNVLNNDPDSRGILVDFNIAHEMASKEAEKWDIMVIKGVEITRGKLGDYNAIFTTDNNKIYDPNLEQTIRNARKQGAFIFHNHPQVTKDPEGLFPPHCEDFYNKGLIDGIELSNGISMWYRLLTHCIEAGFTPIASSDAHGLISARYPGCGKDYYRNMTLILAKNRDEKSIKEALKANRAIAYHANMLIGKEELLQELFKASVTVESLGSNEKNQRVKITNNSSFPYAIRWEGKKEAAVFGMGSAVIAVDKDCNKIELEIRNMYYGKNKCPKVVFKLK